ncbi:Protein vip1 [Coemansia sp. BCRC 34490]|nr:Protein vip1 [Coemansia sp. BCRC 34490]
MVTTSWKTAIPGEPDPRYIEVNHISLSADENTVKNFFAFCGQIESLELRKEMDGTQSALIKFADAEAAKTSLLLTSAQINHEFIRVSSLFPDMQQSATPPAYNNAAAARSGPQQPAPVAVHTVSSGASSGTDTSSSGSGRNPIVDANYEGKPALYVVHELLAAGYFLGEHVVSRASEFDSKYRVTDRTQEQARSLDNQYKFSNHLQRWDEKFNISARAKNAYNKLQSHPVGQKVAFTVNEAYQSAMQLSQDAKNIAERKRGHNEQLFGKIPLPGTPRPPASSSAQQQHNQQPSQQQQQYQQPPQQQQQYYQQQPPPSQQQQPSNPTPYVGVSAGPAGAPASGVPDYTNMTAAPRAPDAASEKAAPPSQQSSDEKKQ